MHLPTDINRIDEIVIQVVLTDYLQNFTKERNAERDTIGINALTLRYSERREEKYQAFLKIWDELERTNFKKRLLKSIQKTS